MQTVEWHLHFEYYTKSAKIYTLFLQHPSQRTENVFILRMGKHHYVIWPLTLVLPYCACLDIGFQFSPYIQDWSTNIRYAANNSNLICPWNWFCNSPTYISKVPLQYNPCHTVCLSRSFNWTMSSSIPKIEEIVLEKGKGEGVCKTVDSIIT